MSPRVWAVLPAAGSGQRMGSAVPKQYLTLAGGSVLEHSLRAVLAHPEVAGAVVALSAGDARWPGWTTLDGKPVLRVEGGAERADSVRAALRLLAAREDADALWALVHDAARPCLRAEDLDRLISRCLAAGEGGLLAAPVRDTLKRVDPARPARDQRALGTEPRAGLWRALTPQLFPLQALLAALEAAEAQSPAVTDEAMAMERAGVRPLLVEGADDNLKITTPADLALAEFLLSRR
ncbi:2-C-methyl-D-erythritol 4-phosphate cytidylyltransferase [Aquimonas voraii]|uniref:2-C-methyl-D-erythritol 4-phosphate cytidylyltransferase n=1 Tax=Aquimonas voraii TaxID=265719 RepID=A0A1G6SGP2_9GAMM|nr:2-C-methyl-D-erythritol 4-phosphate cytidylyltransferase [Aquimonas voraii]SDD15275.1 2-C-methyl-D-erythritol 4-phosphate cytidylyltransferase [Aquimonas voraii]